MDTAALDKPTFYSSSYAANFELEKSDTAANLHSLIEKLAVEIHDLRERMKLETREHEQFENIILSRIESKERELRHFLIPRSLHMDTSLVAGTQNTQPTTTTTGTTIPIQSTVPAVRPVPSLIGGLVKNTSDGLLTLNSSLAASGCQSPAKMGSSCGSTIPSYSSQLTKQALNSSELRKNRRASPTRESSSEIEPYSEVLVDPSVLLVFSRLRSAQEHCSALVSTNQTDLQSFTFTQNSQNGKRIMMRVRVLKQENEELAILNRNGRATRLETEMLLRRNLIQDLKEAHADMEYLVEEAEAETETLGSSLLVLQQRLNLGRTMAQVLASALVTEDPSGELLRAVVSSKMPNQSADWLLASMEANDKAETAETVEQVQGDSRLSPVIQIRQETTNDLVVSMDRDPLNTPVSPPGSHRERSVKRSRAASTNNDNHHHRSTNRSHRSSHKKSRLSTESTPGAMEEATDVKNVSLVTSGVEQPTFTTAEKAYGDVDAEEHPEQKAKNYDRGMWRNIFDEVSKKPPLPRDDESATRTQPSLTAQTCSTASDSEHTLTNGDQQG